MVLSACGGPSSLKAPRRGDPLPPRCPDRRRSTAPRSFPPAAAAPSPSSCGGSTSSTWPRYEPFAPQSGSCSASSECPCRTFRVRCHTELASSRTLPGSCQKKAHRAPCWTPGVVRRAWELPVIEKLPRTPLGRCQRMCPPAPCGSTPCGLTTIEGLLWSLAGFCKTKMHRARPGARTRMAGPRTMIEGRGVRRRPTTGTTGSCSESKVGQEAAARG
mmetsp:Transcript_32832/g.83063  ORF Transcript_32832/g.83063 Transcript_32832/m.83063 type:complete len:217 (+) Transcript_32832:37-687(+)